MDKAIFLDRDGTINIDPYDYIKKADDFKLIPRVYEAFQNLKSTDYLLVLLTNQSGINRELYTLSELGRIHQKMEDLLQVRFSGIYFCPHEKFEGCNCRKPKPGMLERAIKELQIDLSRSYLIGDKTSDIKIGNDALCHTILLKTGYSGNDKEYDIKPDIIVSDLYDAVDYIFCNDQIENLIDIFK